MQGFEEMLGFPGVVGAIDGTLISIKRFEDFEGFYCRKGFPAFNLTAVVDNELRFIALSIRNGAQNDQSVLNRSRFGQQLTTNLPDSAHYLGDAEYKLMKQMMTPYPITYGMAMKNSRYNYVHSHTRIVVERAFGRLKGMFRIYKQPLLQHTPEYMARIIVATLVMHNWLIEFKDSKDCEIEEWMLLRLDDERPEIDDVREDAKRNRIRDKLYAEYIANN
ncbi:hypothetical protein PI124_g13677 [Phytophthora idaei]|nr:hypothetical protein PI126_g13444 [Phytophthora idaei]KAG3241467.1 hypothetical protein PI124_g13677 [Phytophthora idaei]